MRLPDLSVCIGPLKLKNPVLTASGTFGYGLEFAEALTLEDIGAIVVKGLSLKPRVGNPQPRIAETPSGMLNSIGLQNVGVEAFLREKLPELKKHKAVVLANVFGETLEEYVELGRILAKEEGVSGLELNLSCPNVKKGGIGFGTDPVIVRKLVEQVRKSYPDRFLMAKLTPNVTDICEIAEAARLGGADAVSLINTLRGMAVDVKTARPKLATVTGGLSGPAIRPVALALTHAVCQKVRIPVVGIGGIMNVQDALEYFIVGARAVQIGTANYLDAGIATKIISDLSKELQHRNLSSIQDLIGTLQSPLG